MLLGFVACKKSEKVSDESEQDESEITTTIPEVTTEATSTSLSAFSGPLPSSDIAVTWTETQIDQTVRYAAVTAGEFLRVRKGPGTEYDIVGTLTRNQQVQIVAVTDSSWYKTSDGFYISSTYLTQQPS